MRRIVSGTMLTFLLIGMLTLAFSIQPVKAEPKTWYVDDSGGADFTRIQDAIYAASSGDTIYVYNGTYFENIVVEKTLTLIGENKESTIVDGNNYGHVINMKANSIRVSGFTLQNGVSGIFADQTNGHTIENNILQNNHDGIYLYGSLYNMLNDNLMTGNNFGFCIDESYSNTLTRNEMRDNIVYNFYFDLWGIIYDEHFIQDIDTSNTVDGKPIYWWMYQNSKRVPTDAGFVVLYRSSNIFIEDLELTKNNHGIVFLHTYSSSIENVTIWECETGIALHVSDYNYIRGNRIANNGNGLILEKSSYNIVEGNNIENNGLGIITWEANNNRIYHNNFNNIYQVYNTEPYYSINTWDDGYPSGGNYWSDYTGEDNNSDGIGDTPYIIDADNVDHYPLMNPYGAPPPPTYTLTITATVGGTASPAPAIYSYTANSAVEVLAIPNADYLFDHWELDNVNIGSANPYTVLMDRNHTLKAVFSPIPPPKPVGGYSFPTGGYTPAQPFAPYLALMTILMTIFTITRRKTHRRTK